MKAKNIKSIALLMAIILLMGCFLGCGKDEVKKATKLPYALNEKEVDVIDDLPDWPGQKLDLSVWYCAGTNNMAIGRTKTEDKFQEEMARVSGITLSEKTSFDNGGESCDNKIAKMVATKSWPHVAVGLENSVLQTLVEGDKLYDLTELIPKYMPNYMAYINSSDYTKEVYEQKTQYDGKKYIWQGLTKEMFRYADPEYTPEKYAAITPLKSSRSYVWVRDDILKKIHPEALTLAEQQEIYMKNGKFTKEEITDFTINSLEEFRQLLVDIDELNIKENGRKVWPFYTYDGMDNWSLFATMLNFVGSGSRNSYFVYYDNKENKLKNPVKTEWFKDFARFCNELYRDGLASKEALIDNKAMFDQKRNNGEYAILYGLAAPPTQEVLKAGGKDYAYRMVYVDIPMNYDRFVEVNTASIFSGYGLSFFKDMLTETEVEQILRFLDFFYTDAGMKFAMWGPEKAGLYKENSDGTLVYTDKAFESAMLYDGDDQVLFDYGYSSFPVITEFIGGSLDSFNKYNPKLMYANYEQERTPSNYAEMFNFSYVEPYPDYPNISVSWDIWNFTDKVDGAMQMWGARQTVEDALKTVLVANSDEQFEKYYNELIETEERNGFDDKCFEEMNKVFKELNGGNLKELENWKEK